MIYDVEQRSINIYIITLNTPDPRLWCSSLTRSTAIEYFRSRKFQRIVLHTTLDCIRLKPSIPIENQKKKKRKNSIARESQRSKQVKPDSGFKMAEGSMITQCSRCNRVKYMISLCCPINSKLFSSPLTARKFCTFVEYVKKFERR